jgi:transcription elongation factor GreA
MPIPITARGAKQLKDELQRLKTQDRPNVVKAIAEAREKGDLSENAEYDAARESQAFIEGRIAELESKISQFQVIDPASLPATDKVVFGATVTLEDVETGHRKCYQIVGNDESDTKLGRISVSSPVSRALIGKSEGDVVEVQAPGGVIEYEIIAVEYI